MAFNYSPKIVTDGLVLYLDAANQNSYPGTGTVWTDLSRSGNNGTLINGPTFSSANGGSIVFDGSNDYANGNSLISSAFTINFWLRPLQVRDYNPSFRFKPGVWGVFTWHTTSNGSIYCGTDLATRFDPSSPGCGAGAVQVNVIQCFTYTYNGTATLYKNGVVLSSKTQTAPTDVGTVQQFELSQNPNSANMNLYSFQMYNRALSATEIRQNFNATRTRFGI